MCLQVRPLRIIFVNALARVHREKKLDRIGQTGQSPFVKSGNLRTLVEAFFSREDVDQVVALLEDKWTE